MVDAELLFVTTEGCPYNQYAQAMLVSVRRSHPTRANACPVADRSHYLGAAQRAVANCRQMDSATPSATHASRSPPERDHQQLVNNLTGSRCNMEHRQRQRTSVADLYWIMLQTPSARRFERWPRCLQPSTPRSGAPPARRESGRGGGNRPGKNEVFSIPVD